MFVPRPCLLLLFLAACETLSPRWEPPAPLAAPALEDSIWVCDQHAGRTVSLGEMLDAVSGHEVVFLGEQHVDETTHRLEWAVYEGLIERTGGRVVLALEMFERDVQPVLDDYLAGKIPEADFVKRARAWSNYRTGYRPLIETAKRHGLPVVASNTPVALRRQIAFGGPEALAKLPAAERALLPAELHDNPDAYWERVARVVRGHMGMVVGQTPDRRRYSSQSLWDNTMGESCARALERHPGHIVLHVNGGFHSQYRSGTVHQLLVRRPQTRVAVLEAIPTDELHAFDPFGASDRGDYLVFVKARARGLSQGFHAVNVSSELRFRLHLPQAISDAKPAPLLIWLGDDGFRARDGLALWSAAVGERVAIAAVEPPYPLLGQDLTQGGRWFWQETFNEDLGGVLQGLVRLTAYLLRSYPVDRDHVVLAGEGTGATVVAAAALYSRPLAVPSLAIGPRRFAKLRTIPLPDPIERETAPAGLPGKWLRLLVHERDEAWWKQEAEDYQKLGLKASVERAPSDGWTRLEFGGDEIREALGLPPPAAKEKEKGTLLVLTHDTPRAWHWARLFALRAKGRVAIATRAGQEEFQGAHPETQWEVRPLAFAGEGPEQARFRAEDLADGRGLPLAPGPFGGTTVLVVPREVDAEHHAGWKALQESNAIKKRSRFARLVVVFESDESAGLGAALEQIQARGGRSVLIVPAVFCADAAAMRRLAVEARPYRDTLDLAWLPGLGGRMHRLAGE
ncbi:MAG: ChaN family lipoprotein [Planctomycetota bacterium]|jgi:uncharacterized iron-regulated protein